MQQPHVIYDQDNLDLGNSSQSGRTRRHRKNKFDNNLNQTSDSIHGNGLALNLEEVGDTNMTQILVESEEADFMERMNRLREGDELTQSNRYSFGRHEGDPQNFRRRSTRKNRFFPRNA